MFSPLYSDACLPRLPQYGLGSEIPMMSFKICPEQPLALSCQDRTSCFFLSAKFLAHSMSCQCPAGWRRLPQLQSHHFHNSVQGEAQPRARTAHVNTAETGTNTSPGAKSSKLDHVGESQQMPPDAAYLEAPLHFLVPIDRWPRQVDNERSLTLKPFFPCFASRAWPPRSSCSPFSAPARTTRSHFH